MLIISEYVCNVYMLIILTMFYQMLMLQLISISGELVS
jgi:hypothetical protein